MIDAPAIDMDYQPADYWGPGTQTQHLLASISGTVRRELARQLIEEGDLAEPEALGPGEEWLQAPTLDPEDREIAASIHPMLMGGEYLPPLRLGEVEIARVELASTLSDVISVRARREGKRIRYTVTDEYVEYEGQSYRCRPRSSIRPLTMRQLARLIDSAVIDSGDPYFEGWTGIAYGHVDHTVEWSGAVTAQYFVTVESEFYPQLEEYYRQKIEERVRRIEMGLSPGALDGPALWLKEAADSAPAEEPDVLFGWEGRQVLVLCRTERAREWARRRFGTGSENYLLRDGVAPDRLNELKEDLSAGGLTFLTRDLCRRHRHWHEEQMKGYLEKATGHALEAIAEVRQAQEWVATSDQLRKMNPFAVPLKEAARQLAVWCAESTADRVRDVLADWRFEQMSEGNRVLREDLLGEVRISHFCGRYRDRTAYDKKVKEHLDNAFSRLWEAIQDARRAQAWLPSPVEFCRMNAFVIPLKEAARQLTAYSGEERSYDLRQLHALREFTEPAQEERS